MNTLVAELNRNITHKLSAPSTESVANQLHLITELFVLFVKHGAEFLENREEFAGITIWLAARDLLYDLQGFEEKGFNYGGYFVYTVFRIFVYNEIRESENREILCSFV